ncbi:MAG: DHH family phosphoesterase [Patescibacteria group bacterium]
MEQTPKQQTVDLVRNAKRIVVFSHHGPDGDALGSSLALTLALRKLGKEVVVANSDPVPSTFQFLPAADQVVSELAANPEFVISVNTATIEVDKLGYKNVAEEQKLNIVIKTKRGAITPEMVTFSSTGASADLIFVLDTNDVDRLGSIYDRYTSLFYETPIINIDHHPGNDYFGKVNWIDLTATSTAEILVSLLESLSMLGKPADGGKTPSLIDADIATLLLTGITTDTGSFQNTNTTPKSFTVAAQLVAAGARQQEIVQHIYKTKSLSTLKLWGKILSSVQYDETHRFLWATVSGSDFGTFGASETETTGVIDELLKTAPNIDFALLLSEKQQNLHGSLRGVNKLVSVAQVAELFGGGGHEMAAAFRIANGSLIENEADVLEKIRTFQEAHLTQQTPQAGGQPNQFVVPGASAPVHAVPQPAAATQPSIPSVASLKERQAAIDNAAATAPVA